ncbi:MAG: GNAT family N-acetyltransferase [Caulobacteraceae bacterium]
MSLEVRPARSGELQTCAEIYERAARATFTWFDLENLQERFLADAEEEEVHVAVEDGRMLGLAALYRPDSFLHSLYIDDGARGRGVGLALLHYIDRIADGPVSLKVQVLNHRARAFYAREGFKIVEKGGEPRPSRDRWLKVCRDAPEGAPSCAPDVRITRARANDLPACAALYAWIAALNFTWEPPEARTTASKLSSFESEDIWVAREGGLLTGFVTLNRAEAYVGSLFVEPQGAGIGRKLLATVRKSLSAPFTLRCAELNAAGLRFYLREGFTEISRAEEHGHTLITLQSP